MNKKLKLNQVIAIADGEKSRKQKVLSKVYQDLGKANLFEGLARRYRPFEDDATGSNQKPGEDKYVQVTVPKLIEETRAVLEGMFNVIATQDLANCEAKSDVIVSGDVILQGVPVTHLIFLEKQLVDIETFINAFPVLDPAERWEWSDAAGCYKSENKETISTKKIPKNHVKAEATDKHPAQVELFFEDVPVGIWDQIKFSGNIKKDDKDFLLDKVRTLAKAVKIAREEANMRETEMSKFGTEILSYIFE